MAACLLLLIPVFSIPLAHFRGLHLYLPVIFFALALPAIFDVSKDNRVMDFLGDLTYPLYLTNPFSVAALFATWSGLGAFGGPLLDWAKSMPGNYLQSTALAVALLLFALAVACLAHFLVEKPLAALLRKATGRSAPAGLQWPLAETLPVAYALREADDLPK